MCALCIIHVARLGSYYLFTTPHTHTHKSLNNKNIHQIPHIPFKTQPLALDNGMSLTPKSTQPGGDILLLKLLEVRQCRRVIVRMCVCKHQAARSAGVVYILCVGVSVNAMSWQHQRLDPYISKREDPPSVHSPIRSPNKKKQKQQSNPTTVPRVVRAESFGADPEGQYRLNDITIDGAGSVSLGGCVGGFARAFTCPFLPFRVVIDAGQHAYICLNLYIYLYT